MNDGAILYVNIFLLAISIAQVLANLIVLAAYFRSAQCRKEDTIILLVSLASVDFLYALLFIPYVIYLLIGWVPNADDYNYNPYVILGTGGPPAALMKSGCTITTFIAIDRIIALYFPAKYYGLKKRKILLCSYGIALMMAVVDDGVLFCTTKIAPQSGCSTFACFTSPVFQTYWGISNMLVNMVSCLLTIVVFVGLRHRTNITVRSQSLEMKRKSDQPSTRTAVRILAVSAVFGVVPGLVNGCARYFKIELLTNVGFFVGTCASVSGLSHAFIFSMAHREVRRAILTMLTTKTTTKTESIIYSIIRKRSH